MFRLPCSSSLYGGCAKQEVLSDGSQVQEHYQIGANCYAIRYSLISALKLHLHSIEAKAQEKYVEPNLANNNSVGRLSSKNTMSK